MGFGIAIMGLNGAGKTTLGQYLERISAFKSLDAEMYYFENPTDGYAFSRSGEEAGRLLLADMERYPFFAVSSVQLNFENAVREKIDLAVCLSAPKDERMTRIRNRAAERLSMRVLPGGDMYAREEAFFKKAEMRKEESVLNAVNSLSCPKLFLSGMDAPEENAKKILLEIQKYMR